MALRKYYLLNEHHQQELLSINNLSSLLRYLPHVFVILKTIFDSIMDPVLVLSVDRTSYHDWVSYKDINELISL